MTARLRELAERWRMQSGSMASAAYEACAAELLSILDAEGDGGAVGGETRIDAIWTCKIGSMGSVQLPYGADAPMRDAVSDAYRKLTGQDRQFLFSGWRGTLTPVEQAIAEDRPLSEITHPARSGVVRDEDVEAACVAYARKASKHIAVSPACMRAALEHFAKGERHV